MRRLTRLLPFLCLLAMLTACEGDPRASGITGPFPDGVQANTLSQSRARADLLTDNPGLDSDPLGNSQYVPMLRPRSSAGITGGRYFGYNY
jgi:hypothetical protein